MRHKHFIALFAAAGILLPAQQAASFTSPVPEFRDSIHLAPKKNKKDKNKNQKKAKGKKGKTAEDEQAPSTFPTTIAGLTYAPTTKTHVRATSFGFFEANAVRLNWKELDLHPHLSPHEVHMHAREQVLYKYLHPTLRAWIERAYRENPDNLIYLGYNPNGTARSIAEPEYLLYRSELLQKNGTSGCSILFEHYKFELNLHHNGRAEEAWTHTKEPAVNPHTGRPWICLTPTEQKKVERLGSPLSDKDALFLQDVQDIINENFHYFYGMAYVRPEEQGISNEQLLAKIIPEKSLLFDKLALYLCPDATPQQRRLYSTLGHPIYSYKNLTMPKARTHPLCIWDGLTSSTITAVNFQAGCRRRVDYFQNPCFGKTTGLNSDWTTYTTTLEQEHLFIENSNYYYQHGQYCVLSFPEMLRGLRELCEEHGGNADMESANSSALNLSLYYLYKRTELYCNTIILHLYTHVMKSPEAGIGFGATGLIPRHYKRMSDEIALPGVPGTGQQTRAGQNREH